MRSTATVACRRAAWAAWTCKCPVGGRNLGGTGAVTQRRYPPTPRYRPTFLSDKGLCDVPRMAHALKVADRDPMMNPRILEAPRNSGAFFLSSDFLCIVGARIHTWASTLR